MMRYVCLIALAVLALALPALALTGCGGDDNKNGVDTKSWCTRDGGQVDVIVHGDKTYANVCYNPLIDVMTVTDPSAAFPATSAGATVAFDQATDGHPIGGDVMLDGDFVSIYGNGADATIIDGNVTVTGSNARIRGVTIRGTLTFQQNNCAIVSSRIDGDVIAYKDATLISEDDIFGSLTASSSHNLFVDDRVQGTWAPGGRATCAGNVAFTDTNGDGVAQDTEVSGDLSC